jgi:adiponectin receptor
MLNSGYRRSPTFRDAVYSIFRWHNESINMWTHYLGAVLIATYVVLTWCYPYSDTYLSSGLVSGYEVAFFFVFNMLGNAVPILLSAFCHQFYCIDKRWHTMCWFLDFIGILTGMLCAGMTFSYCTFYCFPAIVHTMFAAMLVAYVVAIFTCWARFSVRTGADLLVPADRFPEFSSVLSVFGWVATLVPVLLALLLRPEYYQVPAFRAVLVRAVAGPVLMGLGITCFAQGHFPERFAAQWGLREGFFDLLGHSHQWWHVLSAALQLAWVALCHEHLRVRLEHGCVYSTP